VDPDVIERLYQENIGPGIRASDGGSIYRPPNEERYCTLAHLDTEEQIVADARRSLPQLVGHKQGPGRR
jgi:hypothetical protein